MRYLAVLLLPLLLVFGLYHLSVWFDVLAMRRRTVSSRVGVCSALAHGLLGTGVLLVSYLDYRSTRAIFGGTGFAEYVLDSGDFWPMLMIFDTLAGLTIVALLALWESLNLAAAGVVGLVPAVVLVVGTLQWYGLGRLAGAVLDRVWSGLKTQDDEGPDWL